MKRKVCVVTGTRADYGIYLPILNKIVTHPALELQLLATGMHLSPFYGETIKEIEKDQFPISAKVDILLQNDNEGAMARSIGIGIMGMTQAFEDLKPDIVLVLGDRGEMLAASIAASHLNIVVAHIHGGEVSGSIDESVRHAITKLSHIHFPSTLNSAERIKRMGEDSWRVFQVGAPRIDTIKSVELPTIDQVFAKYEIPFEQKSYSMFVFHPVSTELTGVQSQIEECMEALKELNEKFIVIMPNSDAGNQEITNAYKKYSRDPRFVFIDNFSPLDYLSVLKNANSLVGNSSSGIIEAASFQIPVMNIGDRQRGREQSANVINVSADKEQIVKAFKEITSESFKSSLNGVENIYGDGRTSERIIKVLADLELNQKLLEKIISY
ncbi:UDP-N-acetylglucosamine 2-epimerase [Mesobacillus jeotgali]|uniref:UDP-N-acetylglucosamine 2-epimerase n=1 Tax=Mesobacillus jeotgali TaxID=129985 RepID=A0ABY9VFD3_9BACI|nr:UDP-N-acetylglucosamine 2-epimerase [Mesobacillus jeotgali]WNF22644.1 UDP-N-acetylglucosamine 2-epimerase [Mesobacillus jeotgali]